MFGLSATVFVDIFSGLGFGLLFFGFLMSFAAVFWPRKRRWIYSALLFLFSAISFFTISYFIPGFSWDVVPVAVGEIVFFLFCLKAGI